MPMLTFLVLCMLTTSQVTSLYSGDKVFLRNLKYENRWLSCWFSQSLIWDECKLSHCPGPMTQTFGGVDDSKWNECNSEVFTIYSPDTTSGQALRWGDNVALKYLKMPIAGRLWLSCGRDLQPNNYCTTIGCPGRHFDVAEMEQCQQELFRIYAIGRQGACGIEIWNNTDECRGDPIRQLDTVFIWSHGTKDADNYWLSGNVEQDGSVSMVEPSTLPGKDINNESDVQYPESAWQIIVHFD